MIFFYCKRNHRRKIKTFSFSPQKFEHGTVLIESESRPLPTHFLMYTISRNLYYFSRDSKVDVKVTPRSLALLRKCLSSNNLNVLIPVSKGLSFHVCMRIPILFTNFCFIFYLR